jgi:putative membrane protein
VLAVVRMFASPARVAGMLTAALALALFDPRPADAVEPGVPDPPSGLLTDRGRGELAEADKDFVIKVRLAGLWEIPAGEMAQEKSGSTRIKSIGRDIADQHVALDKLVLDAAKKLDIELPDKPNKDQQGWLDEMEASEGKEFDQVYIDRLRAAHGKIFPAIATIRTSTRNDTVRKLAQRANQFVMTHLTLLESSGIVDFAALPTAPPPNAATASSASPVLSAADAGGPQAPVNLPVVALLAVAGLGAAGFVTWRLMRDPRRRYRRPRGRGYGY